MMTNGDPEGRFFYPTLTRIIHSFSCSPLFLFIYMYAYINLCIYLFMHLFIYAFIYLFIYYLFIFKQVTEYAKMQFYMMTLLDVLGKIAWVR